METIIELKKQVFNDMRIPWDESIERKLYAQMEMFPNSDPEILLDNIALLYIHKAFADPNETYAAWLKAKYGDKFIERRTLRSELGDEVFEEMVSSGRLVRRDKTQSYQIQ